MLFALSCTLAQTLIMFLMLLWAHTARQKMGLGLFYSLLGCLVVTSLWLSSAGLHLELSIYRFVIGFSVFYTSVLLAVFVIYVFEGPRVFRAVMTHLFILMIITTLILHSLSWQLPEQAGLSYLPLPTLRLLSAFLASMVIDVIFLAIAWEYFAKPKWPMNLWLNVFFTLSLFLLVDGLVWSVMVQLGSVDFVPTFTGTLFSRLLLSLTASPFVLAYLYWQQQYQVTAAHQQPMLLLQNEIIYMRQALSHAQQALAEQKQTAAYLAEKAYTDELTQLANRRYFDETYDKEWKRALRQQQPLSVILCDIDYFKCYNDHYGHLQGDSCLAKVAQTIQQALYRPADVVARYGGEEFVVLLPETELVDALDIAERIRLAVQQLHIAHSKSSAYPYVTLSLGVSSRQLGQHQTPDNVLQQADKALYKAKAAGRNTVWPHLRKVTKAFMRIA
ncbi:diguanylate cyclase [Agitococcus lubricus]|uniref:diguanylate cyclase n=1 Tax=Agitococcus lubricus TaxID=1077255 RepID=A0A2T5J0Q5_9GAMM|nr:diguanylate cyclase [Agitococcus lubricus]PTQ89976.1 diguanylate cyclase (GGDEF)-like protein [Agitococcus lubricus]